MQNTLLRPAFPQSMRRELNTTQPKPLRTADTCGFTRREVRALVAEMLG